MSKLKPVVGKEYKSISRENISKDCKVKIINIKKEKNEIWFKVINVPQNRRFGISKGRKLYTRFENFNTDRYKPIDKEVRRL